MPDLMSEYEAAPHYLGSRGLMDKNRLGRFATPMLNDEVWFALENPRYVDEPRYQDARQRAYGPGRFSSDAHPYLTREEPIPTWLNNPRLPKGWSIR